MCIVICDCEIFWLAAGSCDLGHQAWGIKAYACLLSGVGVDGHIGLSYTALIIVLHMGCVMCTAHGWLHILV